MVDSHLEENIPDPFVGIPVRQTCRRLHFLHAAINARVRKGTQIGIYLVHYADGQQQEIPIVVGKDLADWWKPPNEPKAASVEVWEGTNEASREEGWTIRLFKTAWENPLDEIAVKSIDFLAADFIASPFLVAITVE